MITDRIDQFLDRTEKSMDALDKVLGQAEITLVQVRILTEETTTLVKVANIMFKRLLGM